MSSGGERFKDVKVQHPPAKEAEKRKKLRRGTAAHGIKSKSELKRGQWDYTPVAQVQGKAYSSAMVPDVSLPVCDTKNVRYAS